MRGTGEHDWRWDDREVFVCTDCGLIRASDTPTWCSGPKPPAEVAEKPQVNAFEYDGRAWRRMEHIPSVISSSKQPVVVLDPERSTWRWWAGGRSGDSSMLAYAEAAAKEAWEAARDGPVRYRVDIERSARNPDVLKATLYTTTNLLKRWRVVYGEPARSAGVPAPGHIWEVGAYKWSPERSDQPELTAKEIEVLSAGLRALAEPRAALNPLAEFFEPGKVTAYHPPIPGMVRR